jgi:hypothetical protein
MFIEQRIHLQHSVAIQSPALAPSILPTDELRESTYFLAAN